MIDTVKPDVRSRMMARIRAKDTQPEIVLRHAMHRNGFRYRLHDRKLPGTPDLVFPRFRAVCFVQGCFWHRHPGCSFATMPSTNIDYWQKKFDSNFERDKRNCLALLANGWRIAIVWECALRNENTTVVASALGDWLHGSSSRFDTDFALRQGMQGNE